MARARVRISAKVGDPAVAKFDAAAFLRANPRLGRAALMNGLDLLARLEITYPRTMLENLVEAFGGGIVLHLRSSAGRADFEFNEYLLLLDALKAEEPRDVKVLHRARRIVFTPSAGMIFVVASLFVHNNRLHGIAPTRIDAGGYVDDELLALAAKRSAVFV